MKVISESEFKKRLLKKLNAINHGWIDGDREKTTSQKADMVNHPLKIAIEIKDDTKYKIEIPSHGTMISSGEDLTEMNKRFGDDIRSANRKLLSYPGYKTVLIIRTSLPIADVIRYAIEGPKSLHINNETLQVEYVSRQRKYSDYVFKHIGCFLIFNNKGYYFSDSRAESECKFKRDEVEKIFGINFEEVNQI